MVDDSILDPSILITQGDQTSNKIKILKNEIIIEAKKFKGKKIYIFILILKNKKKNKYLIYKKSNKNFLKLYKNDLKLSKTFFLLSKRTKQKRHPNTTFPFHNPIRRPQQIINNQWPSLRFRYPKKNYLKKPGHLCPLPKTDV